MEALMDEGEAQGAGPAQRSVEIGVAIGTALFGAIVIWGSMQVGIGWGAEGPKSGFFPFYLGLVIIAASVVNLFETSRTPADKRFADWSQLRQVLAITIPTAIYVSVIPWIGIYVSSLILIALFMMWLGSYRPLYALTIATIIIVSTYLTFEKWFLVPLPKGPIEDFLGL
jgi:putative tricarboxylic transport membrane protein